MPSAAELLAALEAKATEATRRIWQRNGCGEQVLGVKMGDVRAIAKPLKQQHALALELWETGWFEARVLATLLMDPKQLDEAEGVRLAESCDNAQILDKLTDYVLQASKLARTWRDRWLDAEAPLLGRAGWNLMRAEVQADKQGTLDLAALLAKVERELPGAPRPKKEAMNHCLVMVGVYHPAMRAQAIAAGERLGRWDDRPVPKGCTSSYPPEWIPAALALRGKRA